MEIQYWISPHEHPLQLMENGIENDDHIICQICNSRSAIDSPLYVCDSCNGYYLHKSCAELPNKIKHPLHPHFPLNLLHKQLFFCNSCHQEFQDSPLYKCHDCGFQMGLECAFMPLVTSGSEGQGWIRHSAHPHPLLLVDDREQRDTKCFGCKSTSCDGGGQTYYGCSKCEYFLDKSCIELPPEIYLPLHQNHRGVLVLSVPFICGLCEIVMRDRYNLAYSCNECYFQICSRCAKSVLSRGSFEYEDHDHLLCLEKDIEDATLVARCNGYDSYCTQHIVGGSDEFKRTNSSMFWCFHCGFRVHLLCGPLPSAIKHEFHIHSLILVDSMHEDDSGEYCCDVCETKRDPLIRLYCCRECKYFAHVHCVIPEILEVLRGDLKDAKLKTVGQDIWNVPNNELKMERVDPILTLKDVITHLSEDEKEWLRRFYKWDKTPSEDHKWKLEDIDDGVVEINSGFNVRDEEIDEILQLSRFDHGRFRTVWSNLRAYYDENKVELKKSDLALKMVKVEGYMIPYSLAPVLKKLLNEFEDIAVMASNLSLGMKSFVFFNVCQVVKRMHGTMAKCITKTLLQEWYFHLRFAKQCGFRVGFARAQLEQLIHAFLGFQAKRLEEEIPKILDEKTAELKQRLDEVQRKLEKCREYRDSSLKSEYMEYCLNTASGFEWSDALGDSLTKKTSTEASRWTSGFEF